MHSTVQRAVSAAGRQLPIDILPYTPIDVIQAACGSMHGDIQQAALVGVQKQEPLNVIILEWA